MPVGDEDRPELPAEDVAAEEVAEPELGPAGELAPPAAAQLEGVSPHVVVADPDLDAAGEIEGLVDALEEALGVDLDGVLLIGGQLEPLDGNRPGLQLAVDVGGQAGAGAPVGSPQEAGLVVAPGVARGEPVHARIGPAHETQRGIEVLLDGAEGEVVIPLAGLVLPLEAVGHPVPVLALGPARQPVAPQAGGAALPEQAAVPQAKVGADGVGRLRLPGLSRGHDAADRVLPAQVAADPHHAQALLADLGLLVEQGAQDADVPVAHPTGELGSPQDGDLLAVLVAADGAREEGNELRAAARRAELEEAGVLEEEVALLREEQREAIQVDLPPIDLGLGEVGVEGELQLQRGRDPPGGVPAQGPQQGGVLLPRALLPEGALGVGDQVQPQALVHAAHAQEQPALREVPEAIGHRGRGPAVLLVVDLAHPPQVEAPGLEALAEVEGLERDGHLGLPAAVGDLGAAVPDAVPLLVEARSAVAEQGVSSRARGGDLEPEGEAPVVEGVEPPLDHVVVAHEGVASHLPREHLAGLLDALDGQKEVLPVVGQADAGRVAGRLSLQGHDLGQGPELRDPRPGGLVESTVDLDPVPLLQPAGLQARLLSPGRGAEGARHRPRQDGPQTGGEGAAGGGGVQWGTWGPERGPAKVADPPRSAKPACASRKRKGRGLRPRRGSAGLRFRREG